MPSRGLWAAGSFAVKAIADAIRFLANQGARAATHELQLTPLAENCTP